MYTETLLTRAVQGKLEALGTDLSRSRLALLRPRTLHRNRVNRAMAWTAHQLGLVKATHSSTYSPNLTSSDGHGSR